MTHHYSLLEVVVRATIFAGLSYSFILSSVYLEFIHCCLSSFCHWKKPKGDCYTFVSRTDVCVLNTNGV